MLRIFVAAEGGLLAVGEERVTVFGFLNGMRQCFRVFGELTLINCRTITVCVNFVK